MNADADDSGSFPEGSGSTWKESSGGVICAACGSTLGLAGPEGGCLTCLAQFALSPDGDEAEADESHALASTFGHFEILCGPDGWPTELGRGAMGITYRARDTILHTEVALKVIGGSVAGHPAARAAFLREARAAARLRHPNVASVFHYGEQDGQCFYVMELVDGDTLEARLRGEGPLSPALALEVGRQVGCALMEAEALGMVHRDLKPSNVMFVARRGDRVDDQPHIKVIDFGLAQAADGAEAGEARAGNPTGFVGTPSFASPEQFAPDAARRVDHRSDIYSLGVTLWYLVCGKLPFGGRTLAEIHAQQTAQPLPWEQLRTANVAEAVADLLGFMLASNPAARPPNARKLLEAIEQCREQLAAAPRAARLRRQKRLLGAAGLTALVLAAAWITWQRTRPVPPPPDRTLAVLPFENLSPDEADAFFTTGLHDQVAADLVKVSDLRIVQPDSSKPYPTGQRDYPAIGRELGVRHLLEGSARRQGDHLDVKIRLVDVRNPTHPWTCNYDRKLGEVFAVQGEIARAVVDRFQVALSPQEKAAINRPPTTDLKAYELYLQGNDLPSMPGSKAERRDIGLKRIAQLREALTRDPDFMLAQCALASAYDLVYSARDSSSPEDNAVDYRALAESALREAQRLQPDAGELHLAMATHFYAATHDYNQANIEIAAARRTSGPSAEVEGMAADIATQQGHWEEAVSCWRKALPLNPTVEGNRYQLGLVLRQMRRYDEYRELMNEPFAGGPPLVQRVSSYEYQMAAVESRLDLDPMREYILHPPERARPRFLPLARVVIALLEHDPDSLQRAAADFPSPFISVYGCHYPKAWFEALAARLRHDEAAARTAFLAARAEVEQDITAAPTNSVPVGVLAMIDAGLGRTDDALREARRACDMSPRDKAYGSWARVNVSLAVVDAWTGQFDAAFDKLNELASVPTATELILPVTYGDLMLNPLWEPLRGDQRFTALTARLAPPAAP